MRRTIEPISALCSRDGCQGNRIEKWDTNSIDRHKQLSSTSESTVMDQTGRPLSLSPEFLHYADRHALFELFQVICFCPLTNIWLHTFISSCQFRVFARLERTNITSNRKIPIDLMSFSVRYCHFAFSRSFKRCISSLLVDRPKDPLTHLIDFLKKDVDGSSISLLLISPDCMFSSQHRRSSFSAHQRRVDIPSGKCCRRNSTRYSSNPKIFFVKRRANSKTSCHQIRIQFVAGLCSIRELALVSVEECPSWIVGSIVRRTPERFRLCSARMDSGEFSHQPRTGIGLTDPGRLS